MNGHQNGAFSCLIGALNRPRKVNGYGADYAGSCRCAAAGVALVVYIPAVVVDEVVALDKADAYLGTELHLCAGLAADDGADVRLEDADDAVGEAVLTRAVHLLLLEVHLHRASDASPFLDRK